MVECGGTHGIEEKMAQSTTETKTQTVPDVRVSTRDVQQFDGDAVAVGVFSDDDTLQGPAAALDEGLAGVIARLRASGEITGVTGEVTLLHTLGKIDPDRVAIVGLGPRAKFDADRVRKAAAIAVRALRKAGAQHVGLALAWVESGVNLAHAARAATEGALLGLYSFSEYKHPGQGAGEESAPSRRVASLTILGRGREPALRAAVERGRILAEAQNFARDLGNEPPNVLTPTELAERAREMAARVGLECEILGPKQMRELGMGALLGVAAGSAQEPRFIVLRHRGGRPGEPGPAFVGKGITFDTGGISLKPSEGLQAMKMDMCGAAAVIGAMQAIGQLKPAINVTGIVPATENMVDGSSYRPGDILTAANGKTIEIVNTDAEGRLALADGISYAVQHHHTPIVDAATLTGACVIALGHVRAGLFSNDEALQRAVLAASEVAGEKLWPMPMDDEYEQQIRSYVADVKQTGGRPAGAVTAAKILECFTSDTPWAHLDIAGVNDREKREPEGEPGATGFGVRTFVEVATELAERKRDKQGANGH
jgi:leucyl aminopeptidase